MLNEGYFDWLYCHKTWVSAAPVLFMEVIAIFEQLYFQPVKQIAYCHVTCALTGDSKCSRDLHQHISFQCLRLSSWA